MSDEGEHGHFDGKMKLHSLICSFYYLRAFDIAARGGREQSWQEELRIDRRQDGVAGYDCSDNMMITLPS